MYTSHEVHGPRRRSSHDPFLSPVRVPVSHACVFPAGRRDPGDRGSIEDPGQPAVRLQRRVGREGQFFEFAKKADQEGYAGAAALFRAAARAEEFHARNHADVIKKLGGTPKAEIKPPAVKSTADNLKASIEGENYERLNIYPEFIAEAKAAGEKDAVKSFNYALAAEGQHAQFYTEAVANLAAWKTAKKFAVCPICKTVTVVDFGKCPVCFTPGDKFVSVA